MTSRVYQVNASLIDDTIASKIKEKIIDISKPSSPFSHVFGKYGDEILALANYYIWKNTVETEMATVGEKSCGLKLTNDSKDLQELSKKVHLVTNVVLPYFKTKPKYLDSHTISTLLDTFTSLILAFKILNFFKFLTDGKYLNLSDRIFKIRRLLIADSNSFQQSMDQVNRTLSWNICTDFLCSFLSNVDLSLLVYFINNFIRKISVNKKNQFYNKQQEENIKKYCDICKNYVTSPHSIGCKHIYCYYCLRSLFDLTSNYGFTCHECQKTITKKEEIKVAWYF